MVTGGLVTGGLVTGGLIATSAASASSPAASAGAGSADSPAAALRRLLDGNRRFTRGHATHPRQTLDDVRTVATGQHPFAIVLGCADSRVAPEILFDQGVGDVFDNRVAGNIVDDLLLASVEFAVEEFGPPVILVLGHERCGAITATIDAIKTGGEAPGHIGLIVDALRPIVRPVLSQPGDQVELAVQANAKAQAGALVAKSEIVRSRVEAGRLAVVAARYDLDTAAVTLLS